MGAVEIATAIGMSAFMLVQPELVANPLYMKAIFALGMSGISMEAGALASALTANRGQNITTRQPAAFRQVIYGTQRVGGVQVYQSTTGSKHDQYNLVIVIATHEVYALENLYLDGRQVYWQGSGDGWSVRNGVGFGGIADGNDHIGPDGTTYNFGGTGHSGIYCEARYGDQLPGDVIGALTANDGTWSASSSGSPYMGGCTYVYLKIEYNQNLFPSVPEIKFTVKGKPVYDPRTGQTTYSHNPALVMADVLTDPDFGLDDVSVNQAQLIAAANICEEQVETATAGTEDRYACHWHYDTSTGPGDVIKTIGESMGGRFSRIGGEWYMFPAAYYGPTLSFTGDHLLGSPQWSPTRSYRDLFNEVRGTYTAPNYPYNTAGDLYDANGWYNGQIQNNFPFAFQPTNYPAYACDTLHGYPADEYLTQDGGTKLTKELGLPAVLSVSQAQRLAKIELLRNRQQGTGTFQMNLAAFQLQPCDTFYMTFGPWQNKVLEVNSLDFTVDSSSGPPKIMLSLGVNETAPTVYEWNSTEELTVYDVPALPTQVPLTPAAPTNMTVTSLVLTQPDGTLIHQLQVAWDTPADARVTQIQVQYQVSTATTWLDGGTVSVLSNAMMLTNIVSGQTYNVRICSVRSSGATSSWVEADAVATTALSPVVTQGAGVANSALSVTGTTVTISPISTTLGSLPVSYYPSGTTVSGVTAGQTNYVYVVDPTYSSSDDRPISLSRSSGIRAARHGELNAHYQRSRASPHKAL